MVVVVTLSEGEKSQLPSRLSSLSLDSSVPVAVVPSVALQSSFSQHHLLGLNLGRKKGEKVERNLRNQINSLGSIRHNVISLLTTGRSRSKVALARDGATSRRTLSLREHSGDDKAQN